MEYNRFIKRRGLRWDFKVCVFWLLLAPFQAHLSVCNCAELISRRVDDVFDFENFQRLAALVCADFDAVTDAVFE
jgi:hypothetical protein